MKLVQCPDCDAMLRPDARYCSNCARNITGERAFLQGLILAVELLVGLAVIVLVFLFR